MRYLISFEGKFSLMYTLNLPSQVKKGALIVIKYAVRFWTQRKQDYYSIVVLIKIETKIEENKIKSTRNYF